MGPIKFLGNIFAAALLVGHLCQALPGDGVAASTGQMTPQNPAPEQKPIYAIAHRVLTSDGVKDAIKHGANAIEVDLCPRRDGWWADHDCTWRLSKGHRAEDVLKTIAHEVMRGGPIRFVWFDFKSVDWCDPDSEKWRYCSVAAMIDMAREYLEPAGIRVLYGFYGGNIGGKGYRLVRSSLNSDEAINVNGEAGYVEKELSDLPLRKRSMSNGFYDLVQKFDGPLAELQKASNSGAFGKVFGWTLANHNDKTKVSRLINDAKVDGLIYGFKQTYYYDHPDTKGAFDDIKNWVDNHSQQYRLANQSDSPW